LLDYILRLVEMDSATALNIELRDASLQAEGDLEFIGTL